MSRTLIIPAALMDPRLPASRLAAAAVVRLDNAATPVAGERRGWSTKVQRMYLDSTMAAAEAARLNAASDDKGCRYYVCPTQIELPEGATPTTPEKD